MEIDATKAYLCGRMSWIPQFNFPAFDDGALDLRSREDENGKPEWIIVSPAELDDPETRKSALASLDGNPSGQHKGQTWGDFLARDLKLIADEGIETIICLPEWWKSEGGRIEVFTACLPHLGLPVLKYPNLRPVTRSEYQKAYRFLLHRMGLT
jgi:hypothetical protein